MDLWGGWAEQGLLSITCPSLAAPAVFSGSKRRLISQRPLTFSAALDDEEDKGHEQQCQQNPSKKGQDQMFLSVWAKRGSR